MSTVEDIQRKAAEAGCKILLPVDAVVASELKAANQMPMTNTQSQSKKKKSARSSRFFMFSRSHFRC